MTRHAIILAALLAAAPATAQEAEDGPGLMERGAQLFLRGLMQEMGPALDELEGLAQEMEPAIRDFADQMGPALRGLMGEVQDWSVYHPPEMLPNGDIILRRKEPLEVPPDPPDEGEIEL